ncbi:MAG: rane-bound lytic murein transglycosylase [Pyrinomonadaceae bacterium]|nr:rane-bound lytic murein transglycosylase [Pyrinomonadaceae bacterium]MDX6270816.1 rane-bound lytic murein transglycosylase [Acidobacteriota bacterium]
MRTSIPRLLSLVAIFTTLVSPVSNAYAQGLTASSLRTTANDVERDNPRVLQIMEKAEQHYKLGELNLKDKNMDAARAEFDKAVDSVLESGMDVRSNPKLQTFYLQLVERVYRMEVAMPPIPAQTGGQQPAQFIAASTNAATDVASAVPAQQPGFLREQKFEPSPLDELSRLELTNEEKQVTTEDVAKLEEAKNAVDFGFNSNALIQQFLNYYQGRGRATMETGMRRSGRYMAMARRIFREEGVPEDIAWLGQVESAWRPTAYSWAAASGLWQFIPGTGARFGLRQNAWLDERNSFEKATRASARYLKFLANRYHGNWELAIGAYNTGEGNIDRAISRTGVADFWRIYPFIAQETRNYVPNILATILIAKNPAKYGFHNIRPDAPLAYDVVNVPSATSLQLIASATDTSVDFIRSLNPELRRDTTPRGESYNLRVPPGRGKSFVAVLKRIPGDRRESAKVISVSAGEDLQSIAARTGTSVAQLQMWNSGVDLSNGGKVVVPAGAVRNVAMVRPRGNVGSSLISVRARAGETLAQLAARQGVGADEVARLNALSPDAALSANQEIKVPSKSPASGGAPAAQRRRR